MQKDLELLPAMNRASSQSWIPEKVRKKTRDKTYE